MRIQSLQLVYFSPTGTTKRIVEGIAGGMNHAHVERLDITEPRNRKRSLAASEDTLLVIGVPVYFGRVQENAMEWLHTMQCRNTPVVCVVVYGNRAFDDALLELKETVIKAGCIPVACAAYIGEHSFSSPEIPIAAGRPDATDLLSARAFGKRIMEKIAAAPSIGQYGDISVPGHYPYRDMSDSRKNLSNVDLVAVDGHCAQCGVCADLCPVGAISFDDSSTVDKSKCILCHACIKRCPAKARHMKSGLIENVATRLSTAFQERKEPLLIL